MTPVLRDAARYIIRSLPKTQARIRGDELLRFLTTSDVGTLGFVRMWAIEILAQRPEMTTSDAAMKLAADSRNALGVRPTAIVARSFKQLDWVREQKETWQNHGPWDRRAVIWASGALPPGERRHWLSLVQETKDPLDRAVAQLAAAKAV